MAKKCKYYLRKFPQMDMTSCGHETEAIYAGDFCEFCGKKVKEVDEEIPKKVMNKYDLNMENCYV